MGGRTMKRITFYTLAITVLVLCIGQSPTYAQTVTFSSKYTAIDTSKAFYSYDRSKFVLDNTSAEKLAESIFKYTGYSLSRDTVEGDDIRMVYRDKTDPSAVLEINRETGFVMFNAPMKDYLDVKKAVTLPLQNSAPTIAVKYLKELNLFPSEPLHLQHVGGISVAVTNGLGISTKYDRLVTVTYGRELDGIPVVGAARIVVNLGHNNELVSLIMDWPKLEQLSIKAGVVSNTDLKDYITKELKKAYPTAKDIVVDSVKLINYDDGKGYIEPAVIVFGGITMPDATTFDFDWLLPLKNDYKADYPNLARIDDKVAGTDE
jgi:hypothetical protein